jgi:hypothetical protein
VQISHNHLSGTATVGTNPPPIVLETEALVLDPSQVFRASFEYTAWAFSARGVGRGNPVGVPGNLVLGGVAGSYDACPAYNIVHLSPTVRFGMSGLADQRIGVSTCAQDLRQDYIPHYTKLELHIWNAHEVKFTGAWECADSTHNFLLSHTDTLADNLSRQTLGTSAAHMQIRGVASTQCVTPRPTETVGLVAVSARILNNLVENGETPTDAIGVSNAGGEIPLHGTTANTAGVHAIPGFVLWDPQDAEVPEAPRR